MKSFGKARISHTRRASRATVAQLRFWQVWPFWVIFGVFLVIGAVGITTVVLENRPHKDDVPAVRLTASQDLHWALDKLEAGRMYLFSQADEQGRQPRFVVERTPDGKVRSMLASCRACYRSERRHYTRKGEVICGTCNHAMHRPDEPGLTSMQKQCTLVAVAHVVKDGQLTIQADEISGQIRALETDEQ